MLASCYGKEGAERPVSPAPAPQAEAPPPPVAPGAPVERDVAGAPDLSAERFARIGERLEEDMSDLASPDPETRADAVDLLDIDQPEVLDLLGDIATGDVDPRVRVRAVEQLGFSDDPRARDSLRRALDDSSPDVVAAAATELGAFGDPEDARYLEPLRDHPSPTVREEVGFALELLRD